MGPRAGLDGCGTSRPHRDSNPDRPARSESLYRPTFTVRYGLIWRKRLIIDHTMSKKEWLMRLVAGFSPRRHRFGPRSLHVRLVVDRVAIPKVLLFFLVSVITTTLHRHIHLHVARTRRSNGHSLVTLKEKKGSVGNRGALDRKIVLLVLEDRMWRKMKLMRVCKNSGLVKTAVEWRLNAMAACKITSTATLSTKYSLIQRRC